MPLAQDHIEAILASMLAVNAYGIEKAYALLPELRKIGLTNPVKVANSDIPEVMVMLGKGGYHRGMLAEMMAGRVINLMKAVTEGQLDALNEMVAKDQKVLACDLLCQVKGIGPKVASDAWMLVNSNSRSIH